MKHEHGPPGELMAYWTACSEQFLEAAGHLPPDRREMVVPRMHLMSLAVEYRLKAFVCARRHGTPESRDLTHLARLAALCGLTLAPEQAQIIAWLNSHVAPGSPAPGLEMVDHLCRAISAQARAGSP